jgi:hypothetical protein
MGKKSHILIVMSRVRLTQYNPGDKNMNAVGAVYVNASLTLLNEGSSSGTIFSICKSLHLPN